MGEEHIIKPNCKHQWEKHQYKGLGVIATWEYCPLCKSERKRTVTQKKGKEHLSFEKNLWADKGFDVKKETGVWD